MTEEEEGGIGECGEIADAVFLTLSPSLYKTRALGDRLQGHHPSWQAAPAGPGQAAERLRAALTWAALFMISSIVTVVCPANSSPKLCPFHVITTSTATRLKNMPKK